MVGRGSAFDRNACLRQHPRVDLIGVAVGGFFILGGQGALNNLTAHWYETEVRGTAVGMMLGIGRIGGILGPYVTGALQQTTRGSSALFLAIGLAALVGVGAIVFARPCQSPPSSSVDRTTH